ncbi:hypothetical protein [Nocardia asteroides]|uniref:hypothetical protein n=1 Tax=Nocardia asteroides TaxID=1824 RepID=UPI0034043BED
MIIAPKVTNVCQTNESTGAHSSICGNPKTVNQPCGQLGLGHGSVDNSWVNGEGDARSYDPPQAWVDRLKAKSPRTEFYIIARLETGDSAADVYSREIFDDSGILRHIGRRFCALPLQPGATADLDGLDHTLAAAGYQRSSSWRPRITHSGATRYFADATTIDLTVRKAEHLDRSQDVR